MDVDGASNPCNSIWYRQDQSIVGALLGSCDDVVQPIISNAATAHDAWKSLHSAFASTSRGRVLSLKSQLSKNPRGDRSIADYLFDMQTIANELALIQNPISEEDLVVHVLNQVGEDYDAISSTALLRPTSIPFTELGDILKDHERKLKATDDAKSVIVSTANYTQQQRGPGKLPGASRDPVSNVSSNARRGCQIGSGGARPSRSHVGSCQFCDIQGYDVKDCRKLGRFLRNHGSENGGEASHRG
ncbi:unnamed protein product [Cuscuta campestris]|uniref:Retrotransposon gag domain-containing protein n=1 Tax=Cuscuta campestris TaxID=132261 RepID=A0A484M495_9ASTE|nr:unnamed protein product [Cuscuta campestris]